MDSGPDPRLWCDGEPQLSSVAAVADRFELSLGQLEWLADVRGLERSTREEKLRNYRYRLITRRSGRDPDAGVGAGGLRSLPRLIEAPKGRLKEIQRIVLRELLGPVPTHPAAHGFVAGRSVVSQARLHSGRAIVVRLDLRDFFASVTRARVRAIFRAMGYPRAVAVVLAGLCTNVTAAAVTARLEPAADADPNTVWRLSRLRRALANPHLPQGAPPSPALANLAAFRLDRRLIGLARSMGFAYSRYADDLVFSGDRALRRGTTAFLGTVGAIALDEGFAVNERKSAVLAASARQRVCGVVVNAHPNLPRDEYDRLRAVLHNCVRHGPASQNRDGVDDFTAHLRGRIAWVASLDTQRGARLQAEFDRIDWSR